jgi:hypothetical protein
MNRSILLIYFVIIAVCSCYPNEKGKDNESMSEELAFCILSNAAILYIKNEEQITAFLTLMKGEYAIEIFCQLLQESKTAVGEFYALLGLFECDKNYYSTIIKKLNTSKKIRVRSIPTSDVSNLSTLEELKKAIENGVWIQNITNP